MPKGVPITLGQKFARQHVERAARAFQKKGWKTSKPSPQVVEQLARNIDAAVDEAISRWAYELMREQFGSVP